MYYTGVKMNYCRYFSACVYKQQASGTPELATTLKYENKETETKDSNVTKDSNTEIQRITDLENDIVLTEHTGHVLADNALFLKLTEYMILRFAIDTRYDALHVKFKNLRHEHKLRLIRHMWSMRYDKGKMFNLYLVQQDAMYRRDKANNDNSSTANTLTPSKPCVTQTLSKPQITQKSSVLKTKKKLDAEQALDEKKAKSAALLSNDVYERISIDVEKVRYIFKKIDASIIWSTENGMELYDEEIFDRLNKNLLNYISVNLLTISTTANLALSYEIQRKYNSASKFHQSRALSRMADQNYSKKLSEIIREDLKYENVTLLHISQLRQIEKYFTPAVRLIDATEIAITKTRSKLSRILSMTIDSFDTISTNDSDILRNGLFALAASAKRIIKLFNEATLSKQCAVLSRIAKNRLLIYSEIRKDHNEYIIYSIERIKKIIKKTRTSDCALYATLTPEELDTLKFLKNKLTILLDEAIKGKDPKAAKDAMIANGRFIRSSAYHQYIIVESFFSFINNE